MTTMHRPRLNNRPCLNNRPRIVRPTLAVGGAILMLGCLLGAAAPVCAGAAKAKARAPIAAPAQTNAETASTQGAAPEAGTSLESAAAKAGDTARTVAMSLIGLALAIASIVLAFRRDFKEAAGVFAVGIVAVLLATPAGLSLLQDTVTRLFGS
jgi:hypothetical protein